MFSTLQKLAEEVVNSNEDFSKYKNAKDVRKNLQALIVEARKLRKDVNEAFKASKKK